MIIGFPFFVTIHTCDSYRYNKTGPTEQPPVDPALYLLVSSEGKPLCRRACERCQDAGNHENRHNESDDNAVDREALV